MTADSEYPIVSAIKRQREEIAAVKARHKQELSEAKAELHRLARSLSEIEDMTERLRVARVCRDQKLCSQNDLAWAVFGNEKAGWHLRYALRPMTRPCHLCRAEVRTNKTNFEGSHSVICDRCAQRRSEEWAKSSGERARKRAERERRKARLMAKSNLTKEEIVELADFIIDEFKLSD